MSTKARYTLRNATFPRRNAWTVISTGAEYAAIWLKDFTWDGGVDVNWPDHGRFQGAKDQVRALHEQLNEDGDTTFVLVKNIATAGETQTAKKVALVRGKMEVAEVVDGALRIRITGIRRMA